jgi:diphthamide biosynthesis protein 4
VGSKNRNVDEGPSVTLLKEAYTTLSQPQLRARHDVDLAAAREGPRPAVILSLDDLQEGEGMWEGSWSWTCRCGGIFRINEANMEEGQHLIGCSSCSEVIWVGYELAEEE